MENNKKLKIIFSKDFLKELLARIKEHDIMIMSYQVSYNLLLAIIPSFVIIINILISVMSENISYVTDLVTKLPEQVQPLFSSILDFIINQRSTGILSFGVLAALYAASRGVKAMRKAFDKSFNKEDGSSFIKNQLLSLTFTLLLALVLVALIFAMATGPDLVKKIMDIFNIPQDLINPTFVNLLRILIPLSVMILVFTVVFLIGASESMDKLIPIKPAFLGGLSATISCSLISIGYGIYVSNFSNMQSIYGPLVGIMIFLIWINYIVLSILISGELTATILSEVYGYMEKERPKLEKKKEYKKISSFVNRQKDLHEDK
ncbi:MAG: YihY/virulence factor BrkB family protein [Lagierella massiliensis]|nr:YihY/virulence factor BrkB family protein [Lagierella massiliensis]